MSANTGKKRELHRGAADDPVAFAKSFLNARLTGFEKDMRICLTGVPGAPPAGITHAYFPALMNCCGMLEYLAGFYVGRMQNLGKKEVAEYARYLPQPDYDAEVVRILFEAFRNAIAHRGIASGVWKDPHPDKNGRRLTWKVFADAQKPALQIVEAPGAIQYDAPWICPYTHRVHIRLGRLWRDIHGSVAVYLEDMVDDKKLQKNFFRCMEQLYPRDI